MNALLENPDCTGAHGRAGCLPCLMDFRLFVDEEFGEMKILETSNEFARCAYHAYLVPACG